MSVDWERARRDGQCLYDPMGNAYVRRDIASARIAELEALSNTSICIFCGETMDKDLHVMLDHAKGCEKRPENNLLKRAEQAEAETRSAIDQLADAYGDKMEAEAALAARDLMLDEAILILAKSADPERIEAMKNYLRARTEGKKP